METIRLFPSFSGLLHILKKGFIWEDSVNSIYMFGCMKDGIEETFQSYDPKALLDRSAIMAKLEKAESEGRVLWRTERNMLDGQNPRMEWLLGHINAGGFEKDDRYENASWNLPALHDWIKINAPWVDIFDSEYGLIGWRK